MKVARVMRLPLSALLAWSASDVLVAAWDIGRDEAEAAHITDQRAVLSANLTAVAFHDPSNLKDAERDIAARAPWWLRSAETPARGTWDDFAKMAMAMGAVR